MRHLIRLCWVAVSPWSGAVQSFKDEPLNDNALLGLQTWRRVIWLFASGFGRDAHSVLEEIDEPALWDDPLD